MALCELSRKIRRFYILNTQRKRIEKEEAALKADFRERAAGSDRTFVYKDIEVTLTTETRTSVDTAALRAELGDKIAGFEKTTESQRITVRKKEAQ